MAQQTAVEWYYEQTVVLGKTNYAELLEQAKQMEKEQIIDSYKKGEIQGVRSTNNVYYSSLISAEQCYNETYGNNTEKTKP